MKKDINLKEVKYFFYLIIIFLFFISVQSVISTDIWINPFEVKEIKSNVTFTANADDVGDTAIITLNTSGKIERNFYRINECRELGEYEFCVKNIEENISIDRGIIHNFKLYPAVQLNYSEKKADVSITRNITTNNPYVNMKFNVSIKLVNNGEKKATDITFKEIIPENFTIISHSKKLNRDKNILFWNGEMLSNREENFVYELMPRNNGNYQINGQIEYNSLSTKKSLSSNYNVNAKNTLEIIEDSSNLLGHIGENLSYKLNITNKYNSSIEIISLSIITPEYISNTQWNGNLNVSESKEFLFEKYINRKIEGKIITEIKYMLDDLLLTFKDEKLINTQILPLNITIFISNTTFESGEKGNIQIVINNSNKIAEINDIICKINFFEKEFEGELKKIGSNNSFIIGNFAFTAPKINKIFPINVECDYKIENIAYKISQSSSIKIIHLYDEIHDLNISEIDIESEFNKEVIIGDSLINQSNDQEINEDINPIIELKPRKNIFQKFLYWIGLKK
jgi:uncharacterized repeat protein (TIGR01451 family)